MIGPIRGNSWRLLISLSLRLRVVGSVLRQLSANRDMDLFLGTTKVPYTFRDLDRSVNARISRFVVSHRFFSTSLVRQEEFVVWKYRAASTSAFRRKRKMKREKLKKAKMQRNTRAEKLLIDVVKCCTCLECVSHLDDSNS